MSRRHIAFPLGSEMWKKELSDHQRRLQTVKPTLPMTPSAPGSSRPGTNSGRGSTKRLTSPGGGTPSQRGGGAKGEAAPSATAAATTPTSGLRIEDLNPSDQSTCKSMVDVLQRLSTAEGKTILEELFVAAEMKRLLSHYTGVYPTAASDENDEQESKKTSAKETDPKPSAEPSAEPLTTQSQEAAHPLPLSGNNDKSGSVASSRKSSGNEETQRVGSPKTKEHSKRHHNHRHERGASSEEHTTPPPSGSAEVSHASEKHSVAVTGSSASVQSGSYRSEKAEDNSGREGGSLRRDGSSDHKGVAPPPPAAEKSETIDEEGAYEDEKFD